MSTYGDFGIRALQTSLAAVKVAGPLHIVPLIAGFLLLALTKRDDARVTHMFSDNILM